MNLPAALRLAFCAAVPACLLFTACEPTDSADGPPHPYKAAIPPPRRAQNPDPANAMWLAAWRDLRTRLSPLEEKLAGLQKVHSANNFDAFLDLDPETLGKEQLCSLFHFLQRGYFTVERRVLIHLLERRLDRTGMLAIPADAKLTLKDHLANAMHRDEVRMVDMETAIQFYEEIGDSNFTSPGELTEEEEDELRSAVADMLDKAREEIADMEKRITQLKQQAFGESAVSGTDAAPPGVEAVTEETPPPATEE